MEACASHGNFVASFRAPSSSLPTTGASRRHAVRPTASLSLTMVSPPGTLLSSTTQDSAGTESGPVTYPFVNSTFKRYTPTEASFSVKRYTADHEAVVFDDTTGIGTISITDHAQSSLGDVVFVELPTVGTVVEQGGE